MTTAGSENSLHFFHSSSEAKTHSPYSETIFQKVTTMT